MKSDKGFFFFYDWIDTFSIMSDEEAMQVIRAIAEYERTGTDRSPEGSTAKVAYMMARQTIERTREISEIYRNNGIKKYEKESNLQSNAQATQSKASAMRSSASALPSVPVTVSVKSISSTSSLPSSSSCEKDAKKTQNTLFERFWEAYPKKVNKKKTSEIFPRIVNEQNAEEIMAAIAKQKMSDQWVRDDGRYIPAPDVWLRNEKWNDELPLYQPTKTMPTVRGEANRYRPAISEEEVKSAWEKALERSQAFLSAEEAKA